jgi:hypothetical protein
MMLVKQQEGRRDPTREGRWRHDMKHCAARNNRRQKGRPSVGPAGLWVTPWLKEPEDAERGERRGKGGKRKRKRKEKRTQAMMRSSGVGKVIKESFDRRL